MAGLTMASAAFVACTDYTIMDDNVIRMGLFGEEYSENFQKAYGAIDPKQTWDFSLSGLRSKGLLGGPNFADSNNGATRAAGDCNGAIFGSTSGEATTISTVASTYYNVEQTTLNWLNNNLKEGYNHLQLGDPFSLVKPEDNHDFLIIPIYQGNSNMEWDLHLVAKNTSGDLKDYMIWTKSKDLKYTLDYSKTGGEEFFYNTDGSKPNCDIYNNDSKKLKLGRVFSGFNSADLSDKTKYTTLKFYFVLPPHSTMSCRFGDVRYDEKEIGTDGAVDWYWHKFVNTEDVPHKFEYDLSTNIRPNGDPDNRFWPNDLQYFGIKEIVCENCAFNTYAPEDARVRIFAEFGGSGCSSTKVVDMTGEVKYTNGHTINRTGIQSKPIRIKCSEINEDFFLYLDVTYGEGQYNLANTGTKQRSDEGQMLALLDKKTSDKLISSSTVMADALKGYLGETDNSGWEYFVVGAEDANLSASDWDLNDVVFLIAGKKAPKIKEVVKKRYMIEDLGSTYDFDFNDIVLDVTQERYKDIETGNYKNVTKTAKLVHLCGTIPFKIEIGNTVLGSDFTALGTPGKFPGNNGGCQTGGNGYDPTNDATYAKLMNVSVPDWDPTTNNIKVTVWPKENTSNWSATGSTANLDDAPNGMTYYFPADGKNPFMIAVDQTVGWTHECMSVPANWFTTWEWRTDWEHDKDDNLEGGINEVIDNNILPVTWNTTYNFALNESDMNKYCTMNADVMADVEKGDQIYVFYNNAKSGAKARFMVMNPATGIEQVGGDVNISNEKGEFSLFVTEALLSSIKMGMAIQGQGFTFEKVRLKKIQDLDWENNYNFAMTDFEHFNYSKISAAKLANIEVGDEIILQIGVNTKSAEYSFQRMDTWAYWGGIHQLESDATSISLKVTSENIEAVKTGLAFVGKGYTVKKVILKKIKELDWDTEYNFALNKTGYYSFATMNQGKFADVSAGDVITINVKIDDNAGKSATIQKREGWTDFDHADFNVDWSNKKITFKVTSANITTLKAAGMAIMGKGYTIVNVTKVSIPQFAVLSNDAAVGSEFKYYYAPANSNGGYSIPLNDTFRACESNNIMLTLELPADSKISILVLEGKDGSGNTIKLPGMTTDDFYVLDNKGNSSSRKFGINLNDAFVAAAKNGSLKVSYFGGGIDNCSFTSYGSDASDRVKVYFNCGHAHGVNYLDLGSLQEGWNTDYNGSSHELEFKLANGESEDKLEKSRARGWNWNNTEKDCSEYSYVVVNYNRESTSASMPLGLTVHYVYDDNGVTKDKYEGVQATSGSTLAVKLNNQYKSRIKRIYLETQSLGKITLSSAYLQK